MAQMKQKLEAPVKRLTFEPVVERDFCKGCVLCVDLCPVDALDMTDDYNSIGYHVAFLKGVCTGCLICEKVCPELAIKVVEEPI